MVWHLWGGQCLVQRQHKNVSSSITDRSWQPNWLSVVNAAFSLVLFFLEMLPWYNWRQFYSSLPLHGRTESNRESSLSSGAIISVVYIKYITNSECLLIFLVYQNGFQNCRKSDQLNLVSSSSSLSLQFKIENLPSGSEFRVNVYARNEKGISDKTEVKTYTHAIDIKKLCEKKWIIKNRGFVF